MPAPYEHKTVKARILQYAQEIGWTFVTQTEYEARRGFVPDGAAISWRIAHGATEPASGIRRTVLLSLLKLPLDSENLHSYYWAKI